MKKLGGLLVNTFPIWGFVLALWGIASVAPTRLQAQSGNGARVVATCGTLPQAYSAGSTRQVTVNTSGQVCQ